MKMNRAKLYRGGLKNVLGEKQTEAASGREENVAKKAAFKVGPQARTDPNAGGQTPVVKANQVAVPGRKHEGQ
jgi:hypothetical protein